MRDVIKTKSKKNKSIPAAIIYPINTPTLCYRLYHFSPFNTSIIFLAVLDTMKSVGKEGQIMIESDTIKLLRECDAGVKMGTDSIEDVLRFVKNDEMRKYLSKCKTEHEKLKIEIDELLEKYKDNGKDPNPIAKSMSWMKTNVKMGLDESDETIADLMTDGCNMGVKSLNRYLNEYEAADEVSKDITKRLINLEEKLAIDIRQYL